MAVSPWFLATSLPQATEPTHLVVELLIGVDRINIRLFTMLCNRKMAENRLFEVKNTLYRCFRRS